MHTHSLTHTNTQKHARTHTQSKHQHNGIQGDVVRCVCVRVCMRTCARVAWHVEGSAQPVPFFHVDDASHRLRLLRALVCVCVRARARACVHACVRASSASHRCDRCTAICASIESLRVCARARALSLALSVSLSRSPHHHPLSRSLSRSLPLSSACARSLSLHSLPLLSCSLALSSRSLSSQHHKCAGALDPLLATLANFTSPQHLKSQLDLLFCLWDVDDGGSISLPEMRAGILKLGYQPCINLSTEDWDGGTSQ